MTISKACGASRRPVQAIVGLVRTVGMSGSDLNVDVDHFVSLDSGVGMK